ncbi:hypothetical protein SUGI_0962930 [Cryptomeria japonica]|nr:hypothetical protein SUGI_0962930 [Cryptomeria japonica]
MVWGGSIKLPEGTNNDAENAALLGDLKLCKEKNLRMIDIEGHSLNVIRPIAMRSALSWKLEMWVEGIMDILKDMDYTIKHVFREINKEA